MTPADFFAKWSTEREQLSRYRQLVDPGPLLDDILSDARSAFEDHLLEALTLKQAAERSGYSANHLGRLIRDGRIPNAGQPNAPRIRRGDLPRKPAPALAPMELRPYDLIADARKLGSRRKGGAHAS